MPRYLDEDYSEDADDEFEGYGEDESDDEPTQVCPYCRREVLEVLIQCPGCGNYFSREDTVRAGHPRWIVLVAILLLVAILGSILAF